MEGDLSNKHSKGDLGVWLTEKTQILSEKKLVTALSTHTFNQPQGLVIFLNDLSVAKIKYLILLTVLS